VAFNNKSGNPSPDFATPEELDAYIKTLPANIQSSLVKKQAQIAKPLLKLLHLEELQSDWHQQGRDSGYKKTPDELQEERRLKQKEHEKYVNEESNSLNDEYKEIKEKLRGTSFAQTNDPEIDQLKQREKNILRQLQILAESSPSEPENKGVPNAPFKKNWEEMALKRLIHHAAEKGYHGIVVTPGAEQAKRYNIGDHIDRLDFSKNSNGTVDISGIKDKSSVVDKTMQTPEQVESLVGKELAQKIFNTTTSFGSLNGLDLQVGGEGMKGFYDKKVPNILNSIGKKYGVKTELHAHPIETASELSYGNNMEPIFNSTHTNAHHFPITEEMRKDVLTNGLPLYAQGGIIHKAEGGNVQPSLTQMKMEIAKKSNPINMKNIGVNEAPGMFPKTFFPPDQEYGGMPTPGGVATPSGMPVGGVDTSQQQPGQQLMPQPMAPPPQSLPAV